MKYLFACLFLCLTSTAFGFEPENPPLTSGQPGVIATATADVPSHLQDISVTIKAGNAQGSGTLVTRKVGEDTVSFVWTAGHVVSDLRTVRRIVTGTGDTKVVVQFREPQIVQEFKQDGRRVGETKLDATVVKYSDAEHGEDLALLMVRRKNAYPVTATATFMPVDYVPAVGIEIAHCGSLLGQFGANSYTTGVLSQVGRTLEMDGGQIRVFDQVTTVSFPGSSGGGMYLKGTGEYVGMLTMGVQQLQGFNFMVPVRRIRTWAKDANVEWAVNPDVAVPTLEEIGKIPVEDSGILPAGLPERAAAPASTLLPSFLPAFGL
jgi:hypothetical protein